MAVELWAAAWIEETGTHMCWKINFRIYCECIQRNLLRFLLPLLLRAWKIFIFRILCNSHKKAKGRHHHTHTHKIAAERVNLKIFPHLSASSWVENFFVVWKLFFSQKTKITVLNIFFFASTETRATLWILIIVIIRLGIWRSFYLFSLKL